MTICTFGKDVIFEVNKDKIKTIQKMSWSGNAKYATHDRHLKKGLVEFTGIDPHTLTIDCVLSMYLGLSVYEELSILIDKMEKGKAEYLILGEKSKIGKNKWVITDFKSDVEHWGKTDVAISVANVTLTFKEYVSK